MRVDLKGSIAVLTGGRVRIGYQVYMMPTKIGTPNESVAGGGVIPGRAPHRSVLAIRDALTHRSTLAMCLDCIAPSQMWGHMPCHLPLRLRRRPALLPGAGLRRMAPQPAALLPRAVRPAIGRSFLRTDARHLAAPGYPDQQRGPNPHPT
jgi:hypothetical protein